MMSESIRRLRGLTRPRLLIQAARAGLARYDRTRDLARVLRGALPAEGDAALEALLEDEAEAEARRRAADAGYEIGRHVELLIALMAEARLQPQPAAGG
jgi:hypothetical protein